MHRLKRALRRLPTGPTRLALYALGACGALCVASGEATAQTSQICQPTEWQPCPDVTPPTLTDESHVDDITHTLHVRVIGVDQDEHIDPYGPQVSVDGVGVTVTVTPTDTRTHVITAAVPIATPGEHTLRVVDCDTSNNCVVREWKHNSTRGLAPPDVSAHNGDNVNFAQGSATMAYATPAYVSMDQARSVGLLYSSSLASPRGVVRVQMFTEAGPAPTRYSLQLRRADGTAVMLIGNRTEVSYASVGGSFAGLEFDASAMNTGAYDYTLVMRRHMADGSVTEQTTPVRVTIVNERHSRVGSGWILAGVPRLHVLPNGIVATAGDGTGVFFARNGNTYTSPDGDFTTVSFDGSVYHRRYVDGSEAVFAPTGLVQYQTDRFGNRTTYTWGANAQGVQVITAITDPVGKVTQLAYHTAAGSNYAKLATITDPSGRITRFAYADGQDNLTSVVEPDNVTALTLSYNAAARQLAWWSDRTGARTDVSYDEHGKLARITRPSVTLDGGQSLRPEIGIRSVEQALLPSLSNGTASSPAPLVGDPTVAVTDEKGKTTTAYLNRFGQATQLSSPDPKAATPRSTFDTHGRLLSLTVGNTPILTRRYSADRANPYPVEEENHATGEHATYNRLGASGMYLPVTVTIGSTEVQRNYYSGAPLRLDSTRSRRPTGGVDAVTRFTYDARGRVTQVIDPRGQTTTYAYHPASMSPGMENTASIARLTPVGTRTTSFGYDAAGRATSVNDPAGNRVTVFDAINRVTSTTGPSNTITRFGFDDANRAYTLTDPKNQVYTTRLNAAGWPVSRTDPRGGIETFRYDARGRVTSMTTRRGHNISSTYDDKGRLLTRTAPDGGVILSYDTASRWVEVRNGESTDTIYNDYAGRPTKEVSRRGVMTSVIEYAYPDTLTTRISVSINGGTPAVTTYSRHPGSLSNTVNAFGQTVTASYNGDGSLRGNTYAPLQLYFGYTQYADGALESQATDNPEVNHSAVRWYARDLLRRTTITDYQDFVRLVQYDGLNRLSSRQDQTNAQAILRQDAYTYDAVGNRTDHGGVTDLGNRLTQFDGFALTYDAEGNTTSKRRGRAQGEFEWNTLGQLTRVRTGGGWVTYGYDGMGRRVRKTINNLSTRYVYAGANLVAEVDAYNVVQRQYAYFPGVDRPLAMRAASGQVLLYQQDGPGNVTTMVDTNRQVVNEYRYDPWGMDQDGRRTPIQRMYNGGEHKYTPDMLEQSSADGGFWSEGLGFYLEPDAKPNHQAVYSCLSAVNSSRFLSADPNCAGQRIDGLIGYAANSQLAGTTPLYAFEHAYAWNYFYTTDPAEADRVRGYGWRDAGIHAYVYTTPERSMRAAVQRTANSTAQRWTLNSAEPASSGFQFSKVGFYLEERARSNHQAVYGCAASSGGGQFLSADPACAGQGTGRMLGYASNTQVAGTVPLRAFERGYWNYHYTTTLAEAQQAINNGWRDAGIHAYVYTSARLREQMPQPLRFTGREYDEDTGLYNYRARWYDPHLGRFLSEDPIRLAGGINPHAYVGNDPVNYSDPSGLCPPEVLGCIETGIPYTITATACDTWIFLAICGVAHLDEDLLQGLMDRAGGGSPIRDRVRADPSGGGSGDPGDDIPTQTIQQCHDNLSEVYGYLGDQATGAITSWGPLVAATGAMLKKVAQLGPQTAVGQADAWLAATAATPTPILVMEGGAALTVGEVAATVGVSAPVGWIGGTKIAHGICNLNPNAY